MKVQSISVNRCDIRDPEAEAQLQTLFHTKPQASRSKHLAWLPTWGFALGATITSANMEKAKVVGYAGPLERRRVSTKQGREINMPGCCQQPETRMSVLNARVISECRNGPAPRRLSCDSVEVGDRLRPPSRMLGWPFKNCKAINARS